MSNENCWCKISWNFVGAAALTAPTLNRPCLSQIQVFNILNWYFVQINLFSKFNKQILFYVPERSPMAYLVEIFNKSYCWYLDVWCKKLHITKISNLKFYFWKKVAAWNCTYLPKIYLQPTFKYLGTSNLF